MDHASAPAASPAPRFWSLDALRGACALVVFLSHWHLWSGFPPANAPEHAVRAAFAWLHDGFGLLAWPTGGNHPAVICFFVLSGFCIHYPFERRARNSAAPLDWRDHYRRRFWRIMPVYWAAALLGLALVAAEAWRPSGSVMLALHTVAPIDNIVVRLLGLYGVYPHEILAGNYPLNTVAVEMVIYAAYPWFYFHAIRGRWGGLAAAFLGLQFAGIVLLRWVTPFWVFNSVFMLGIFWWSGAWAARWFVTRGPKNYSRELLLAWLAFLALKTLPYFYGLNLLKQNAWGLVCTIGLLQCLHLEEKRPALRQSPALAALRYAGQISYPLYAVHAPAMMLATWALLRLGQTGYSLQLTATLITSLAATLAIHYGIERVFYRPRIAAFAPPAPAIQTVSRPTQS